MKNQIFQSRYSLFKTAAALCALVFLCSCTSTVYDMRQLDQPVVLNNNPFLVSGTASPPKVVDVDTYSASVLNPREKGNSDGTITTTTVNTAQLNAFLKIGGEPNYFIHDVSVDLTRTGNAPLDIQANGEVAEIQNPLLQPAISKTEQSLTNQPVQPSTAQK